ncbi:hypothetical protein Hdeb2414_s0621g00925661 [Helianthus debilis subsp. tardiflorus]
MIMNRSSSRDSLIAAGARNHYNNNYTNNHNAMANGVLPHRRGMPLIKNNNSVENSNANTNTDLFSRNRTSLPAASSDESDLQARLARLSVGSAKPSKNILDDLLSSNEGGKNDYDWLLTPPGTPLVPLDAKESQPKPVTARSKSSVRSSSINKTSRLSVSQSESNYPSTRPTRSSSVTRPSISTTQYTSYSNRNTNILNTSSASVSSYIRPSTPTNRSSTSARASTPSTTRTTPSRGSTPSRTRPSPASSTTTDRTTRPSQTTRPSTPSSSSRPQTPGSLNSPMVRPSSRPSTPTRRTLTPSLSQSTTSSVSGGRGLSSRAHGNGHVAENVEPRRTSHVPESLTRKPVKSLTSENGTGFGRNISKKSLDMAIKHMDIRNGGARPLSGSTLFPQSIRSSSTRTQPGRTSSAPGSIDGSANNGLGSENGNNSNGYLWNRGQPIEDQSPHSSKLSSEVDIYESSRYDAILLKEDLKNTSWLHSADDKTDEGLLFDNGFESLPEPFGPL